PTTRRAVRSSHHLVAVSDFTGREVSDYYGISPDRISVVPNGVDLKRFHDNWDEQYLQGIKDKYGLPSSFYLYVGPFSRKKNLALIIETYSRLTETIDTIRPVVVAGDPRRNDLYYKTMEQLTASRRDDLFHFIGFVPDEDLPPLTAAAEALIYPSLYEGFGLPILEAMASGTPVLAADSSSIPEVAGDAAILFDPSKTDSLAAALNTLWVSGCREDLKEKGLARSRRFTWKKSAEGLAAVMTGEYGNMDKT
ncbi:MAG: glycosyltransferase family 4 protein, partial [Candidatus Aminicenantes bacterium]|nr:glycosyltransferase family 4 protein [Candidatus Aminicenantes bacterium]